MEIERGQRHTATGSVAFSSPKKSRGLFLFEHAVDRLRGQTAHPYFRDLDDRMVEGHVGAEQDAVSLLLARTPRGSWCASASPRSRGTRSGLRRATSIEPLM